MLDTINLENILFLDIETVPVVPAYGELDERISKLWDRKSDRLRQNAEETPEQLFSRAGIYAEFGKIICIGVGSVRKQEVRIKAFAGDDERQILDEFADLLTHHYNKPEHMLCAHNGKEFDFPYIARRMLVNRIRIPAILDSAGRKPWEVKHLDTMELWKFGDHKNYTSLELLAALFNIATPKDDIDGSMVGEVYWKTHDLPRIVNYCCKDVATIVQIMRCYKGEDLISADNITIVSWKE